MKNDNYLIITPTFEDAEEICLVITKSIIKICAPDYQDDTKVLDEWLANKTPENVAKWINTQSNLSFAALDLDKKKIIGFILANDEGEILLNYLLPEYLFQGIGKALLLAVENAAKKLNLTALTATSTITAKNFYEKNGFIENGEPIYVGNILGEFPLIKYLDETNKGKRV